jgi:hypothetical protein
MIIKDRKGGFFVVCGAVLALAASLFTVSKQQVIVSLFDTYETVMATSPGFSSARNISDPGDGRFDQSLTDKATAILAVVPKVIGHKLFNYPEAAPIERLDLDISFLNFQAIMDDRSRAITNGILSNPTTVRADLRFRGNTYKASLRLKGDLDNHWNSRHRVSLRVNVKQGKAILGFTKFSLQKPASRAHPYDQTFQDLMRKSGNLASVHKYVHVFVNGSNWGVMNVEEHVTNTFLEKLRRKESAVIRFGDERDWYYEKTAADPYPGYRLSHPTLNIHLYGAAKYLPIEKYRKWLSYIARQRLLADHPHLYDVETFSRAMVLAMAWDHTHALGNHNSRYYFNPYTLRLEPITTDQLAYRKITKARKVPRYDIYMQVMAADGYEETLPYAIADVSAAVQGVQATLDEYQSYFPLDRTKDGQVLVENMRKVAAEPDEYLALREPEAEDAEATLLAPDEAQAAEFSVHLHVRHLEDGRLQLFNLLPEAVRVRQVFVSGEPILDEDLVVPGYADMDTFDPVTLETGRSGVRDGQFKVETEYKGHVRHATNGATLRVRGLENPLLAETPRTLAFLKQSGENQWEIPTGEWAINRPVTVKGDLTIQPGATLRFAEGSYLIVKGALTADAPRAAPIVLEPLRSSWKGLYVLEGERASKLRNVVIRNTSALQDGLLDLTGAVTFYNTVVALDGVRFEGTRAEDALNLVQTPFTARHVEISDTVSDGIDFDFSDGFIGASKFLNVGGDALDFSGSRVTIDDVVARGVKDKAVSVGEASFVNVTNSDFSDVGVGIASKDGSRAQAENVAISDYELHAAMTYIKKDFYGTPSLSIDNSTINGREPYSRQEGTALRVDDIDVEAVRLDVDELYSVGVMRK